MSIYAYYQEHIRKHTNKCSQNMTNLFFTPFH